jgi:hypothetical protein
MPRRCALDAPLAMAPSPPLPQKKIKSPSANDGVACVNAMRRCARSAARPCGPYPESAERSSVASEYQHLNLKINFNDAYKAWRNRNGSRPLSDRCGPGHKETIG